MSFIKPVQSKHTVRASATLTGSYVAGTVFSVDEHNFLGINVVYTNGDETSMELKVEVSNDGGSTYFQRIVSSTSGGTTTNTLNEQEFTATGNYALTVHPIQGQLVKISVKATGGTPTGTAAITAVASHV